MEGAPTLPVRPKFPFALLATGSLTSSRWGVAVAAGVDRCGRVSDSDRDSLGLGLFRLGHCDAQDAVFIGGVDRVHQSPLREPLGCQVVAGAAPEPMEALRVDLA